ncbi:glutathione S-transferase family protein [Orrella marina]|uniref:Glutathione S-transferase n=1 Tax=Orrella marina TaxID=2163011 RepID=A0A2R4XIT7_9BURK|nr:glutathione S-transferase family protein [Orrella marina]AWB33715.1 glutathione S-transferase [Orrella marina]
MVRIWGRANSINVQKVLWACEEVGVRFDRIDAGMQFGVTTTPEFRVMNPNGLVPVLDDGGFTLWESHAILRYLARRYGTGGLWPADEQIAARTDQWMDWCAGTVWPDMKVVFLNLVRRQPPERDMQAVEQSIRNLGVTLGILDAHLAVQPYVAGTHLSVGDIPIAVNAYRWFELDIERPALPHLQAWYGRVSSQPGFVKHCAVPLT